MGKRIRWGAILSIFILLPFTIRLSILNPGIITPWAVQLPGYLISFWKYSSNPPNYSNQALLVGGLGVNGLVSKPLVLSTREGLNGYFGIAVMNDS